MEPSSSKPVDNSLSEFSPLFHATNAILRSECSFPDIEWCFEDNDEGGESSSSISRRSSSSSSSSGCGSSSDTPSLSKSSDSVSFSSLFKFHHDEPSLAAAPPKRRRLAKSSSRGLVRSRAIQSLSELHASPESTVHNKAKNKLELSAHSLYFLQPGDSFQPTESSSCSSQHLASSQTTTGSNLVEETRKIESGPSSSPSLLRPPPSSLPTFGTCILEPGSSRADSSTLCPCLKCLVNILDKTKVAG